MASPGHWCQWLIGLLSSTPSTAWLTLAYVPPDELYQHVSSGRVRAKTWRLCAATASSSHFTSFQSQHADYPTCTWTPGGSSTCFFGGGRGGGHVYVPYLLTVIDRSTRRMVAIPLGNMEASTYTSLSQPQAVYRDNVLSISLFYYRKTYTLTPWSKPKHGFDDYHNKGKYIMSFHNE